MKKVIALIMMIGIISVTGCISNPYESTMKSLNAPNGILAQNVAYVDADTSLSKDQKERRITEITAVKLVIERSVN